MVSYVNTKKKRKKKAAYKGNDNRGGMLLLVVVLLLLASTVTVKSRELKVRDDSLKVTEAELQNSIAEEEARAESLDEYEKYTKTKKYIEDMAKDKLGMVHDGEIIFRSGDDSEPVG